MTGALSAVASLPDGTEARVVLKLKNPGTPADGRHGHFGPTSLACELTCASIARSLGVPVPDYGIAEIGPIFANGIADTQVRNLLLQNLGPNFATVLITPRPMSWRPDCTLLSLELRQAIDDVLSFDATIFNGDRSAANPNLLWDGGKSVHMIDHGLACLAHSWDAATIAASPLLPDPHVQSHCGYRYLRGNNCTFDQMHGRWSALLDGQYWADLRATIPAGWERAPGDLDRMFQFLSARAARFGDVNTELRRVVQ